MQEHRNPLPMRKTRQKFESLDVGSSVAVPGVAAGETCERLTFGGFPPVVGVSQVDGNSV